MTDSLLTAPQTALRLGVSARTVHRMVRAHQLEPVTKLPGPNGAYLFDEAHVKQFAADRAAS